MIKYICTNNALFKGINVHIGCLIKNLEVSIMYNNTQFKAQINPGVIVKSNPVCRLRGWTRSTGGMRG